LLLVSAAGVGCSGAVAEEGPPDGGGGAGAAEGGGQSDAGSAACNALIEQSTAALAPAYQKAADDESCATDGDCLLVPDSTQCSSGCGVITNHDGVAVLTAALEEQNAGACGQFTADGCVAQWAPCTAPIAISAQCIANRCVSGLPAGWISFAVETDTGGYGTISDPVQCAGTSCTVWTAQPDGTLYIQAPAGQRTAHLSAADLATADGILRDPDFRQLELIGGACDQPTGSQHVTIDIARLDDVSALDISGCITSGPSGSGFARLYALLQSY
jgi:hypothetical protein